MIAWYAVVEFAWSETRAPPIFMWYDFTISRYPIPPGDEKVHVMPPPLSVHQEAD
jgi:hypothetical protein